MRLCRLILEIVTISFTLTLTHWLSRKLDHSVTKSAYQSVNHSVVPMYMNRRKARADFLSDPEVDQHMNKVQYISPVIVNLFINHCTSGAFYNIRQSCLFVSDMVKCITQSKLGTY